MAGNRFALGKRAIAECDRCGFQYPLKKLRALTIKLKLVEVRVCPTCWEEDHPQLLLGMLPVDDPQALRTPRPDNTYWQGGMTGLRTDPRGAPPESREAFGTPSGGSRIIQWGWNPVGLNNVLGLSGLDNALIGQGQVGTVMVVTDIVLAVEATGAVGSVVVT